MATALTRHAEVRCAIVAIVTVIGWVVAGTRAIFSRNAEIQGANISICTFSRWIGTQPTLNGNAIIESTQIIVGAIFDLAIAVARLRVTDVVRTNGVVIAGFQYVVASEGSRFTKIGGTGVVVVTCGNPITPSCSENVIFFDLKRVAGIDGAFVVVDTEPRSDTGVITFAIIVGALDSVGSCTVATVMSATIIVVTNEVGFSPLTHQGIATEFCAGARNR